MLVFRFAMCEASTCAIARSERRQIVFVHLCAADTAAMAQLKNQRDVSYRYHNRRRADEL